MAALVLLTASPHHHVIEEPKNWTTLQEWAKNGSTIKFESLVGNPWKQPIYLEADFDMLIVVTN
ncbi:predicted protein [Sclerotinia sclerotiorum 1980 UF-70]|uniref:Uncharacterized protein n=2 Tax=Sclerotinia sclerotiorum (strain ATCC 18683 / 1980 / Ss-1) TaxID=665079 RepID=A7EY17_SCLS1|nr:predicted protein [Sclerotinia sclerotiorum 1980 UF-70]APA16090.1 hypothetical protein sscle_16g108600 [Sclerotinia sclerotiorum 1980 UF-70]EDN94359.1 predicted protein [Sclerotinia sclerotiorum 1980 UF-70]